MSERLLSGRFTKEQSFFLEPFILKTPKSSISVADVMTQIMS
jgi:hypothetical protein